MRAEELKSVERLKREIEELEEKLEHLRAMKEFLTSKLTGLPSSKNLHSRVESLAIKNLELEEKLLNLRGRMQEAQEILTEKILSEVCDAALQRMLLLKFVDGLSYRRIARLMNYSLRRTYQKIDEYIDTLGTLETLRNA